MKYNCWWRPELTAPRTDMLNIRLSRSWLRSRVENCSQMICTNQGSSKCLDYALVWSVSHIALQSFRPDNIFLKPRSDLQKHLFHDTFKQLIYFCMLLEKVTACFYNSNWNPSYKSLNDCMPRDPATAFQSLRVSASHYTHSVYGATSAPLTTH